MKTDNWALIKQIEFIKEAIEDECQEYLYYQPYTNKCIYERIKNASSTLLYNALRLFRNQTPLIKTQTGSLTIENTKDLLFKMYQIMLTTDFPIHKENKIKTIMYKEFALNSEDLLQTTPTIEQEYFKNLAILNGKN